MDSLGSLLNLWDFESSSYEKDFPLIFDEVKEYLLKNPNVSSIKLYLNMFDKISSNTPIDLHIFSSERKILILKNKRPNQFSFEPTRAEILNEDLNLKIKITFAETQPYSYKKDLFPDRRSALLALLTESFIRLETFINKDGIHMTQLSDLYSKRVINVRSKNLRDYEKTKKVLKVVSKEFSKHIDEMKFFPILDVFFSKNINTNILSGFSESSEIL